MYKNTISVVIMRLYRRQSVHEHDLNLFVIYENTISVVCVGWDKKIVCFLSHNGAI